MAFTSIPPTLTPWDPALRRNDGRLPDQPDPQFSLRGRAIPHWVILLAGYAASRAVSLGLLAAAYAFGLGAGATLFDADGGNNFFSFLQSWDGLHYRQIAEHGYPMRLPIDGAGNVQKNSWAFLPLYPILVRGITLVSGLDFTLAAIIVSVLFGGAATFALYRLLLPRFGQRGSLWGALFFCFGPMSFLFDVAYADGMFIFFMLCAVIAMTSRRWLLMIPFAVAASFAHPGAIALAAAAGIVCFGRLVRRDPRFSMGEKVAAGTAILVTAIAGFAWPVIAGVATSDPSAYFDTETAWWSNYVGHSNFVPFSPWFIFAGHYLGGLGIALVLVAVGAFVYWLIRRSRRIFGLELAAYIGSYAAYLLAVFLPQQSVVRMLLPLSPLLGHPALAASRLRRRLTLAACILLQAAAVLMLWDVWPP